MPVLTEKFPDFLVFFAKIEIYDGFFGFSVNLIASREKILYNNLSLPQNHPLRDGSSCEASRFAPEGWEHMNIVCLDMEGVLVPEIWIAFSEESGIPELRRTTRDEPDYDKLMRWRLGILKEHGLGLREIQAVIAKIDPLPGAKAFLGELRTMTQALILSDTFEQFAKPLMEKLNWPTIFCNSLEVGENGEITGYRMRCEKSKLTTVKALQSIGYETIACGDSFNDLGMIQASKAGFLFKSTEKIKADYPQIPAYEDFPELLDAIRRTL